MAGYQHEAGVPMTPIRLPFNERLAAKALWCNNTCFAISLVWPWIMRTFMSLLRTQAAIPERQQASCSIRQRVV